MDRNCEWGDDGKERNLYECPRGIIVEVKGEPEQEQVEALYVCFGPEAQVKGAKGDVIIDQKDEVEVNGTVVPCAKIKASELVEVYPHDSRIAKESWRRLFKIPVNVGVVFENRKSRGGKKRKIMDRLELTARHERWVKGLK